MRNNNDSSVDLRLVGMVAVLCTVLGVFCIFADSSNPLKHLITDGAGNAREVNIDASNRMKVVDDEGTNYLRQINSYLQTGTVAVSATFSGGASETNAVAFFNFMKTGTVSVSATLSGGLTETNFSNFRTNWEARTPASLGQKAMTASFPVVIASDQSSLTITDGSGALTVDGTVTIGTALPAGTNAIGRATCDYGSGTFIVGDGSGALNVIVDSSALPTGAATSALQDSTTNRLASIQTTLDGVTNRQATAQTSLTTLAGAVAGSEMQVDVLTMPTVTVTDGSGALNVIVDSITAGDNDIGNVDLEIAGTAVAVNAGAANAQTIRTISASDDPIIALVDGIEGLIDGIETSLTTIIGHLDGLEGFVDGIEALIGTSNTQTADLDANTDGIEGQLTSIQAALDFQTNGVLMASGVTANGAVYSNLVKASAAKVYSINIGNTNGNQVLYGKVFNQASAVAVGGITPVYTFIVPGATNGAGNNVVFPNGGLALSSGFYLAITAGPATNDATAVTGVQVWGATYR